VDRGRFALRSGPIEKLAYRTWLPARSRALVIEAVVTGGGVTLRGASLPAPAELPPDGSPRWLTLASTRGERVALATDLGSSRDRLHLYVSQPDQAPWAPRFPFATGIPASLLDDRTDPYVVEGPGWVIWGDRRVTRALLDVELTVERRHAELVVAAIRRLRPQLVCHVATVTDRLQHAFLAFHSDPGARPVVPPPDELAERDPVTEGYELADAELGRILAEMPPTRW